MKEIVLLQRNDYERLLPAGSDNVLPSSNTQRTINQNQNNNNNNNSESNSNDINLANQNQNPNHERNNNQAEEDLP